jgi:uncharacterized protein (DUF849 family)
MRLLQHTKREHAIAHIHVRDPQNGKPFSNVDVFNEVITMIKSKCDVILCLTTGGALGMPIEQRIAVVPKFKPELASLNAGSINYALFPCLISIKTSNMTGKSRTLK